MSNQDLHNIQLIRQIDHLVQNLVNLSEDVHKLELNPASRPLKKQVTFKLIEHIDQTRDFINLLKTLNA